MHRKTQCRKVDLKAKKKKIVRKKDQPFLKKDCVRGNTLFDYVDSLKTPLLNTIFPLPCICSHQRDRIAFASETDEHIVEAVLYNIRSSTSLTDGRVPESKAHVEMYEGQELYGSYGKCGFCVFSTWLLSYLAESYKKDQPLTKEVHLTPKKKRKSISE